MKPFFPLLAIAVIFSCCNQSKPSVVEVNGGRVDSVPVNTQGAVGMAPIDDVNARFNRLRDSLRLYESTDWAVNEAKLRYIEHYFGPNPPQPVLQALLDFRVHTLRAQSAEFLEKLLADRRLDTLSQQTAFEALHRYYTLRGDLDAAGRVVRNYRARFPASAFFREGGRAVGLLRIEAIRRRIDSIAALDWPDDRKLWATAQAYRELATSVAYFEGEVCPDVSLADSLSQLLVRRYPQSAWADDAEIVSFMHHEGCSHEGGDNDYNLEANRRYAALLRKYPQTEWKFTVLLDMAYLYVEAWEGDRAANFAAARRLLGQVEATFPDSLGEKVTQRRIDYLRARFADFDIAFTAKLARTVVRIGEPVEVRFMLVNNGPDTHRLRLYSEAGMLNFRTEVFLSGAPFDDHTPADPAAFHASGPAIDWPEPSYRPFAPRQSYEETWDLRRYAIRSPDGQRGAFAFDRPGYYRIVGVTNVHGGTEEIRTPPVDVQVAL